MQSSIDGLLDKTIKHMLFLRSVTNQADKLRHPILREVKSPINCYGLVYDLDQFTSSFYLIMINLRTFLG